ncbi:hypothetical protein L3X38_003690 [Prunus dulcis]|uniref:poly(A)-specific ribonuclease n=1 Tax=Prunus dulcis TaxID=3755 RepID=A0AAD4ZMJ7_PRUDU|nr:hypothetical protein L3X38_003690 [Prunus dulcis]
MKIRGVWAHNFHQELSQFDHCLHRFPVISFDTEFPGFLRDTPRDALEDQRYEDVKFNVESLKLLQLGFTLSDAHGNIGGTWEFHLSGFNEKSDPHVVASISLLKRNGLDFARLGQFGISVAEFVFGFLRVLRFHRGLHDLTWVCFHGLYDLAYLLKLLTQKPLPDSVVMFAKALGVVFGTIYDVKFMARYCRGFFGGEIGLARVAKLLDVERSGEAHQAGSDSLLTAAVFSKMNATFRSVAGMSQGCLYGISPTIVRYWQPAPVILRRPCFPVAAPRVYGYIRASISDGISYIIFCSVVTFVDDTQDVANSKPKCKRPIEKTKGAMTCTPPCKFEFCWLCLGAWSDHGERTGGFYACNLYEAANKKGVMEKLRDIQRGPESQLKFITDTWQCRRVLKWTYAYGYYLPENEHAKRQFFECLQAKRQFFECLQGEAVSGLERLHQCALLKLQEVPECVRSVFDDICITSIGQNLVANNWITKIVLLYRALSNSEFLNTEQIPRKRRYTDNGKMKVQTSIKRRWSPSLMTWEKFESILFT